MKARSAIGAVAIGILMLAATKADASLIQYNSLASFEAASSGLTLIDFDGLVAPGDFASYGSGPLVLSGVTFTSDGSMFVIDPGFYGSSYGGGGFLNSDFAGATNTLTAVDFPSVTAVAFDFGGLFGPATFTVNFSTGDSAVIATTQSIGETNSLQFVGFTSTLPITSIQFLMPDTPEYNAIDNVRFGTASTAPVPEPTSLLLVGTGALFLRYRSRRR
jgi:hypothetical protein